MVVTSRELRIPNKYPERDSWATFLVSVEGRVGYYQVLTSNKFPVTHSFVESDQNKSARNSKKEFRMFVFRNVSI